MDRRSLITGGLALAAGAGLAPGAWAQVASLPVAEQRIVRQTADYLQSLKMAKGHFLQTNSRGGSSRGVLYLNRPGKARFEYDPPAEMVVVADGHNVSVYDRRLKTFDRYPLGATPLGIFLSRRIRLDDQIKVTRLTQTDNGFIIGFADARGGSDGRLELEFTDLPTTLLGWTVIDGQGVKTHVRLEGLTPVDHLDPALFVLNDPSKDNRGPPR